LWIALLIFSPFIVDATVTLTRRAWQGEKIWLAHRSHYYQRLVQLGWGHKRTVLTEYVLMAICSASAVFVLNLPVHWHWIILAVWVGIYAGLIWGVHQLINKKS
jgi:UDP-N-acetylmuramyl pentapeptide phosphotransferase/UDP-N-acetylglucosamine-1-phosphate transferase